jgi:CheY-like chemotaxis protein
MLDRMPKLEPRGKRLADNALEGARRAARLTSQLLSFSRRQRLDPQAIAPHDVVDGIADLLDRSIGEQVSLVVVEPAPGQWAVLADRGQLEIALFNLVINARDAIDGDGTITITLANRSLTAQDIESMAPEPVAAGDYVSITVTDTGRGMSREVMQRAFEPFFTTKPSGAGTGLGLSQTYGFASQSGGTVTIGSTPGIGTSVEILLPRAPMDAVPLAPASPGAQAAAIGRGETILFVEDDALLRETITEALQQQGYSVISAADAGAALQVLNAGSPLDLLFTDIVMPGELNGVGLAQAARAQRPDLKIMFASGYSDRSVLAEWTEALDLVAKPYSLEALAVRISSRLAAAAMDAK